MKEESKQSRYCYKLYYNKGGNNSNNPTCAYVHIARTQTSRTVEQNLTDKTFSEMN